MNHLLFLLPQAPGEADARTPWWLVGGGKVIASGSDSGWQGRLTDDVVLTGIAPPGSVRLSLQEGLDELQARTAARLAMVEDAIGTSDTLHSAAGARALPDGRHALARGDRIKMDGWLDWAERYAVAPRQIIPAAIVLPADGGWHEAKLGAVGFVGRDGLAFEDQPALMEALVGDDFVDTLDRTYLEERIAEEAMEPTIDLRQGDYAWRKPWKLDLSRMKEFALLLGLIALAALLIQLVQIFQLRNGEDRLDDQTAALASDAVGRPVAAEEAETVLAGGNFGNRASAGDAIATLVAQIENEGLISADNMSWDGSGMLSVTLAAPDTNAINALLLGLQRDGWIVTASNRPSTDGRALVDVTMRGGA